MHHLGVASFLWECVGGVCVSVGGSDEVASQVVDVALQVHEELLLLALDLNAAETLLGQLVRVVDVDHILLLVLALHLRLTYLLLTVIFSHVGDLLLRVAVEFQVVSKATHHLLRVLVRYCSS